MKTKQHRPGHQLAVALLRGRNVWVYITVLGNSSRARLVAAQRNKRFWARNVFRRLGAQRFSPQANYCSAEKKLFWGLFFVNRRTEGVLFAFVFVLEFCDVCYHAITTASYCTAVAVYKFQRQGRELEGCPRFIHGRSRKTVDLP